jgi:hypothetical protein
LLERDILGCGLAIHTLGETKTRPVQDRQGKNKDKTRKGKARQEDKADNYKDIFWKQRDKTRLFIFGNR